MLNKIFLVLKSKLKERFAKLQVLWQYDKKRVIKTVCTILVLIIAMLGAIKAVRVYQYRIELAKWNEHLLQQEKANTEALREAQEQIRKDLEAKQNELSGKASELEAKNAEAAAKQAEIDRLNSEVQKRDVDIDSLNKQLQSKRATQARLASANVSAKASPAPKTSVRSSTGYVIGQYVGQCTTFVGMMLGFQPYGNGADIANTLVYSHGWHYSSPQPGSVGSQGGGAYGHVVYALAVSGGSVYIAEGNYGFSGAYNERWVSAGEFIWASR